MSKLFEKSQLVNKLPKDDPECNYVNNMMEMASDFLRELMNNNGERYDKIHGVVPKCKLPPGYNFGKLQNTSVKNLVCNQKENKVLNIHSQNSSNSNSTSRMDADDLNLGDEKKSEVIETVTNDLRLSSDEEDDHNVNRTIINNGGEVPDSLKESERIFETLNKCSSKIPRVNSLNLFRKHYGNSKSDNSFIDIETQNSRKDPSEDASCTGDTEPFEDSNESAKAKPQDVMKLIQMLSASKPEIKLSTFEPVYNEINRKRQAMKTKKEEDDGPKAKIPRYMVERVEDSMELRIKIIPELAKEFNIKGAAEAMKKLQLQKEPKSSSILFKPTYESQESMPFVKSENKDCKLTGKCSTSSNTQQLFSNTPIGNDPIKKPQAAAKQIFPQTNYGTKVAVVTGKINKAPPSLHNNSNNNTAAPLPNNQQMIFQQKPQHKSKPITTKDQRVINVNEHEADEQKVVEGLKAIEKLRLSIKSEFMARMRALDTEKWLREADGHKENANNVKGKLEYPPMIIIAVRKYLIYNYSLDVKEQYKKCHETYIKNAEFVCQINKNLELVYKDHMNKVTDPNSPRLFNLKLIKWFTMTMCMKLSAILQYRAFRNVSPMCKEAHSWLRINGILDKDGRTNSLVTENSQSISPFDVLSSYSPGRNSTRNSSPRGTTPANQRSLVNTSGISSTLTAEAKTKLQYYIEYTSIINNSYNDWMRAEMNHAKFCEKSTRHEEAWREIEWKIIEKTGGITINGIDESMAFVIKYLEGFINYMNEFQKNLHPPRFSESRLIT